MPLLEGNAVDFLTDYDDTINRLVKDIDGARDQVHLLFYIFSTDGTGDRIMSALVRAAARGVTCRLLIDAVGSRQW
ncbi:MAG: cardiolipin synthase, partial [Blastomonas sp.]|nr:cardiolipin synthase [Blastomonas sp.]